MDSILTTILQNTYSLTQLKHRVRILKANLLKTFFGGEAGYTSEGLHEVQTGVQMTPRSHVATQHTLEVDLTPQDLNWLKSLPLEFYQQFNKENVYKIFSDIDDSPTHLPILAMYLTFEPDETAIAQLGGFARKQFSLPTLLLDTKFDPNLIAGTALVWKGVYKDYSLRLKIEEKKTEILTGFRRFLR